MNGSDRSEPLPPAEKGSAAASLAMTLIGVGTKLRERLDELLAAEGITLRHFGALGHLAASPTLSTSDLARRAGVTAQSMGATVDQLEALGAIEHRRHGQGRASQLRVTGEGHELLQRARGLVNQLDSDVLADLDNHELLRADLMAVLLRLHDQQRPELGFP